MQDAYLPGARMMLNRLVFLAHSREHSDEEKLTLGADTIGQLWATVQKGRNLSGRQAAGDENQAEVDAVVEEVLGKAWQLTELKEKGYTKQNLTLLELAHGARMTTLVRNELRRVICSICKTVSFSRP